MPVSQHAFQLIVDSAAGQAEIRNFRDAWNREMGALGKPVSSAQQWAAMKEGANLVANGLLAVGAAGAAAGVASVKLAADFDGAMRNVNSIAQLSESQFQALKSEVLDFTLTTRASSTEVAGALYNVVSAGIKLDKAVEVPITKVRELADGSKQLYSETLKTTEGMAVMQLASRAAGAGLADTADTSRLLISALKAYNLDVSQAGKVTDLFLYTVFKGLTTLPQLAQELGTVFPTAHAAGLSLEEVAASTALLTQKGLNTAEATTALNQAIVSILDPSEALAEVFKRAGYESGVAALQELGWAGVMQLINRETGGAADKVTALFGNIRAQRAVFNLATGDAKELSAMIKDFGENSAGAVEKARVEQYKSLAANLAKLKNAAEVLAITMGDIFLPPIVEGATNLTKKVQDLGKAFRDLPQNEQQRWVNIGLGITGAALATGTLIKMVIAAVDAYNKLATAVKAYQTAQAAASAAGAAKTLPQALAMGGGMAGAMGGAALAAVGTGYAVRTGVEALFPQVEQRRLAVADMLKSAQELEQALYGASQGEGAMAERSKELLQSLRLTTSAAQHGGLAWEDYGRRVAVLQGEFDKLKNPLPPSTTGDLRAFEAGIKRSAVAANGLAASMGNLQQFDSGRMVLEINDVGDALDNAAIKAQGLKSLAELGKSGVTRGPSGALDAYSLWAGLAGPAGMAPEVPKTVDVPAALAEQNTAQNRVDEENKRKRDQAAKEEADDFKDRMKTIAGILKSSISEALQPTSVTAGDFLDTAMGKYADKWDEFARRMRDISEHGALSAWEGWANIPPEVKAGGEKAVKEWADDQVQAFYSGLRPEAINWDAFVESYKQGLETAQGKMNMEAEGKRRIEQALGTGEIDPELFKRVMGEQIGGEPTVSPMMMKLLGGSPEAFKGAVGKTMGEILSDPTVFADSGAQVATAFSGAITTGWGQVQWASLLAGAMKANFDANLETNMKPLVLGVGVQLGNWLAEGAGKSNFAAGIVASVMEQLADAVKPQGAPAGGSTGATIGGPMQ